MADGQEKEDQLWPYVLTAIIFWPLILIMLPFVYVYELGKKYDPR